MKGAGSSWVLKSPYISLGVFISFALAPVLCDIPCTSQYTSDNNLVDELATATQDNGRVLDLISGLTKNYDATPFWYNLIHAIAMASGITSNTEILLHDLVTSSFRGDNFNSSLRDVLSAVSCDQDILQKQNFFQKKENFLREESYLFQKGRTFSQQEVDLADENIPPGQHAGGSKVSSSSSWSPNSASVSVIGPWSPAIRRVLEAQAQEQEYQLNQLSDCGLPTNMVPPAESDGERRFRRELRDRRRLSALPDMHQPFFMSEAQPSSLVTRHPSIISASDCPNGHFPDLRGECRQIFQYTVNYGPGSLTPGPGLPLGPRPVSPGAGGLSLGGPSLRRLPWLNRRPRPRPRPGSSSIRDLVRESNFFKHSLMRGYVPPFSLASLQHNLGAPKRPQIMDTPIGGSGGLSRNPVRPVAPEDSNEPKPRIVVMGSNEPPPAQRSNLVPKPVEVRLSPKHPNEMDDKSSKKSRGGSSSESSDSSSYDDDKKKKKKESKKDSNKDVRKFSTTPSYQDDDD